MKLVDILDKDNRARIPREEFERVLKNHLIVTVETEDGDSTSVYIINNVPPITGGQFNKLIKTSFPRGTLSGEVYIEQSDNNIDNVDWLTVKWLTPEDKHFVQVPWYVDINEVSWKKFITIIQELQYNEDEDDFDE